MRRIACLCMEWLQSLWGRPSARIPLVPCGAVTKRAVSRLSQPRSRVGAWQEVLRPAAAEPW